MTAAQCGNGHIYDSDIYPSCPYCNGSQPIINFGGAPVGGVGPTQGPKDGFGGTPVGSVGPTLGPQDAFGGGISPTMPPWGGHTIAETGKTAPIGGPLGGGDVPVGGSSVTLPPISTGRKVGDDQKTTSVIKEELGFDPVVGWLVCIDGADKGKDYRIYGRINTIGRSGKMDICIKGDPSITGENNTRIGYGEKTNRFTLIPADGKNVIYLNGEEVYSPTVIQAYDIIEMGKTTFLFIPLCSDRFTWQKGKTDGKGGGDGAV